MSDDVDSDDLDSEEAILGEGVRLARRTAAIWAIFEAGVVYAVILALRPTLHASQELFRSGTYWYEASMPVVLMVLAGGCLGCLLGWRVVSASGMTGPLAWRTATLAYIVVMVVATISGVTLFNPGVPGIFWVGLVAMTLAGVTGQSFFTLWLS